MASGSTSPVVEVDVLGVWVTTFVADGATVALLVVENKS